MLLNTCTTQCIVIDTNKGMVSVLMQLNVNFGTVVCSLSALYILHESDIKYIKIQSLLQSLWVVPLQISMELSPIDIQLK